jgi:hypothetical protein
MSIGCSISPFVIGDFSSLSELFSEHFAPGDRVLNKTYSEWLYLKNPFGQARIVTATQDGHWLGFMALVPVCLARLDEVRTGYFVVNVLVHQKQRGRNIFGTMIEAAKESVRAERAVLMGHPNSMAYNAWKRAEMHFQAPLKSYFVMPNIIRWNVSGSEVRDGSELEQIINLCNEQVPKLAQWQVYSSKNYLEWRYLRHPTNNYSLRMINIKNGPVGLVVTKKVYVGVNMLIDQFVVNDHMEASLGGAPSLTLAFLPKALAQNCSRLWPAPSRRVIPFFCTDYEKPIRASEVMRLGLSASDF